jgi:transposase
VHLAEPAEASALKGRKKRAKTDWADARHLRELLLIGRLPESWIAPAHILDLRARVRTRHLLSHQRVEWQQRMQAVLYHHGFPQQRNLLTLERRRWIAGLKLPVAAREQLTIALQMIDAIDTQLVGFDRDLRGYARRQTGCRALIDQLYGVGELTAVTILAELGDARRFANSRDAVRYGGLDITVYQSDEHRAPGHLSRQGPPALRWALYEAAQVARHPASPDRHYYLQLAERIGGNRACLALARKLLKRCYHILKELGDEALEPVTSRAAPPVTRQPRDQTMNRGQRPGRALPTHQRGRPRKNERPHHHLPEHPITHHLADPEPTRPEHRSKPGRPRTHDHIPSTRPRTPRTNTHLTGPAGTSKRSLAGCSLSALAGP